MAWSLYQTYVAIIFRSCVQFELLAAGSSTKYIDDKHVKELIDTVLPHQKSFIEKFGVDRSYYLLEEIESSLLKEFDEILSEKKFDKEHIERAAKILKLTEEVMQENVKANNGG